MCAAGARLLSIISAALSRSKATQKCFVYCLKSKVKHYLSVCRLTRLAVTTAQSGVAVNSQGTDIQLYNPRWRRSGFFGAESGLGGRLGAQARDRAFGRPRDTTRQHLSASGAG